MQVYFEICEIGLAGAGVCKYNNDQHGVLGPFTNMD